MKEIKVNIPGHSYPIIIGNNAIRLLGKYIRGLNIGGDAYVVTNNRVKRNLGIRLNGALKKSGINSRFGLVPDNETGKTLDVASDILKDIASYDKAKRIFIIALGGGVIGDLAGFIASVYKRGIPYIQIPTTLLAQVDSSIGGKTAIDLIEGKNLVGAFYQPRLVFSDTSFLKTLPLRQIRSGLAEVIKYGIIKDPRLFFYLEKNLKKVIALNPAALEFIITRSSQIKAKIVASDEREEKKLRTILNFGHTLGHALETAQDYQGYNHGEAIALGMLCACDISKRLRLIKDATTCLRIERLIRAAGLPTKIKRGIPLGSIIEAYYRDKKFVGRKNRLVLLEKPGKTIIRENIPLGIIKDTLVKRTC